MTDKRVDENTLSIKLIKKDLAYMTQGIDDLKVLFREFKDEIKKGFVRKSEFDTLDNRVSDLEQMKDWAIKLVVGAVILMLLTYAGIRSI